MFIDFEITVDCVQKCQIEKNIRSWKLKALNSLNLASKWQIDNFMNNKINCYLLQTYNACPVLTKEL